MQPKLSLFDQHVILYAKGWYKETTALADIKTLLIKFCSFPEDTKIPDHDALRQIALVVHKFWSVEPATNTDMEVLYKDMWEGPLWQRKEAITMEDQARALLTVLHHKHGEPLNLPAPDDQYLPFEGTGTLELWKKYNG